MSFSLKSPVKRAREQAENLLRLADKVDCYRRDVVPPAALAALRAAATRLQQLWDDKKTPAEALDHGSEELHAAMLPCGGDIYPLTFAGEYSEMMMFAAILVIGFRTFFLQPFKIPTNSMFPTYNGMTPFVYALDGPGPSLPQQAWNLVVQGAIHYVVRAPADGEVTLPLNGTSAGVNQYVQQRRWSRLWLIPEDMRQCQIDVGGVGVSLTVPWDFDRGVDEAFYATYFPDLYAQAWKTPRSFTACSTSAAISSLTTRATPASSPAIRSTPATASLISTCAPATCSWWIASVTISSPPRSATPLSSTPAASPT